MITVSRATVPECLHGSDSVLSGVYVHTVVRGKEHSLLLEDKATLGTRSSFRAVSLHLYSPIVPEKERGGAIERGRDHPEGR